MSQRRPGRNWTVTPRDVFWFATAELIFTSSGTRKNPWSSEDETLSLTKKFNNSSTTIELEEPEVIINLLLTTHLQASLTETAMATNFSTTFRSDQVGAQLATDKPIEPAEQTSQPLQQLLQISQAVQQLLRQSEQLTKGTFLSKAMLAQKKEVQHADASGDEPRSYQEAINSSKQDL